MSERYFGSKTEELEAIIFADRSWALTTLETGLKGLDAIPRGENEELSLRMINPGDPDSEDDDGYEVRLEVTQYYPEESLPNEEDGL